MVGEKSREEKHMRVTDGRAGVVGVKRRYFGAGLLTLVAVVACAALAAPQVTSAKKTHTVEKKKTHTVDATMTLAIIEQPVGINQFAARLTGKPFGTAAAVGEVAQTITPTGLITEGRPVVYAKKGTVNLHTTDVVEFQPDHSIRLNGTFEVLGGTGKYKGATGGGTFNAALPAGSSIKLGLVVTFDVDGKVRY
jgi:hypothetical protein